MAASSVPQEAAAIYSVRSVTQLVSASLGLADALAQPQPNFAVIVSGNRIIETGSLEVLQASHPDATSHVFDGMLLMPAMVNSHDHGRGFGNVSIGLDDDTLEIWLLVLRSQPAISPYLAAAYDGVRLLGSGVTLTAHSHNPLRWEDMHAESEETLRGYRDAGIRVAFHPPVVDQNMLVYGNEVEFIAGLPSVEREIAERIRSASQLSHDDYFAICEALFAAHHDVKDGLVHIQVSPAGGQWCSDALIEKAVHFAQKKQTRVQMHMLETRLQEQYALRKWGKSFIQHMDDIHALGPWLTLAHMIWVEPDDFALLAERGVTIAHNPSSNLRVRSGIASLPQMAQAGIQVGIGLDGFALDEDQDYLREMRMAWTLGNNRTNQPGTRSDPLSAQTILHMGTYGSAQTTFGADTSLGRLAPGFLADLVLVDLDFSPLDFVSDANGLKESLLRLASRRHVRHVMTNGEWKVRDGKHTHLNEAELQAEIVSQLKLQPRPGQHQSLKDAKMLAHYVREFYSHWDS